MSPTPTIELKAGAFRQALPLVLAEHAFDDVEVATVLTVVEGPAPAPGDRETAASLLTTAAIRAHSETPPMHIAGVRFEQLITPVDVEAIRDAIDQLPGPASLPDATAWAECIDSAAGELRTHPTRYALAVILERVPCPAHRHEQDPTA